VDALFFFGEVRIKAALEAAGGSLLPSPGEMEIMQWQIDQADAAAQEVPGPGDRFTSPAELLRLGERPIITADEGERSGWGTYDGD